MADAFGPLVSRHRVEQAVIATLQNTPTGGSAPLIVYYLAEVERQESLPAMTLPVPPGPSSYRGGVDANTMQAEWFPMFHVLCQPSNSVEALDRYTYAQEYEIRVISTVGNDDEDQARLIADCYGMAVAALIAQNATLGGIATDLRIARMGDVELLDATDARQVVRSTVVFDALIAPVVTVSTPSTWAFDPYQGPPAWPDVQTTGVTVTAKS